MLARLRREVLGGERAPANQQLERGDGQRVAVAGLGGRSSEHLLGRYVRRRSEHLPRPAERVLARQLGDPEIGDVQNALAVEQQIPGLDVAVDHAAAVCVVERGGRLSHPFDRLLTGHRPDAQRVGDRAAGQKLHHDERPAEWCVGVARLADVVDRHDVAMTRQPGGGAGLALEPFQRGLVAREPFGDQLDSHAAPEHPVACAPDRGHAPRGDRPPYRVTIGELQAFEQHKTVGSLRHRSPLTHALESKPRGRPE